MAAPFVLVLPDGAIGGYTTLSATGLKLTGFLLDITRELPMHPPVRAWNSNLATLDQSHNGLSDVTRATRDIPVCGATSDKLYDWIHLRYSGMQIELVLLQHLQYCCILQQQWRLR
jgi:hypothetical protein